MASPPRAESPPGPNGHWKISAPNNRGYINLGHSVAKLVCGTTVNTEDTSIPSSGQQVADVQLDVPNNCGHVNGVSNVDTINSVSPTSVRQPVGHERGEQSVDNMHGSMVCFCAATQIAPSEFRSE